MPINDINQYKNMLMKVDNNIYPYEDNFNTNQVWNIAYVDGKKVPINKVRDLFMSVELNKGEHT